MTLSFTIIIPIIAAFIGASVAFYLQRRAEKKRDKKQLFAVLMAYRGLTAREDDFVKALNMVDIYFYDNKKVRVICHDYFKHLYSPLYETGHHNRILLDLLIAMAKDMGYHQLTHSDITDYYYPRRYELELGREPTTVTSEP